MISRGKREEIEVIIALTKACGKYLREQGIDQWDENYPDYESIERDLSTQTLFTFREDKTIIGIVVLNETQDEEYGDIDWITEDGTRNLVVHRLAVLPDHQGKGIARKLMDHAEVFAKEEGYDSIRLDTFSQNPRNQKFYQNRGYSDLGPVYLKYKKSHPYYCYELLIN
ncbi:MAG: ribosomal protein S18 acetylase RimI-like enzyme [Crocinitomicaceae bacterium]|jgi:ribosomal protein S18 acetylase RimI-like enzyme